MKTLEKTTITLPNLHTMVRGDKEKTVKFIVKNALNTIQNKEIVPEYKLIPTKDLEPLESQRITKTEWVEKRLKDQGGLDMWAFGQIGVCYDPDDERYYVWDGNGRLALAQYVGLEHVPCMVVTGSKHTAAKYFAYNQDKGRRSLSKEVLFVNQVYSGLDETATEQQEQLKQLGLYVKGDTDLPVPYPVPSNSIEVSYRTFDEGYKIADGNLELMRQARDMIAIAWSQGNSVCATINQDMYWGVLYFLKFFENQRNSNTDQGLQVYLNGLGNDYVLQKEVKWKPKGLSGNSGIAVQLAYGLLCDWSSKSSKWKASYYHAGIRKSALEAILNK